MNINDAFQHLLDNNLDELNKSTRGSYRKRFKEGTLKTDTAVMLLQQYGYKVVAEEQWAPPAGSPGETYFDLLCRVDNKFKIKTVKADSLDVALTKLTTDENYIEDVSGLTTKQVVRIVSKNLPL